jgi:hypothetical protein
MNGMRQLTIVLLGCLLIATAIGCEKESDKGDTASKEEFRIPDSLLAPLQGYKLTRDDYHPIEGGVMANADIELHYPASNVARYCATKIFGFARDGLNKVTEQIARPTTGPIVLIGAKDLDEYKFLTRKEWWYYGLIQGDTIYFEPFDIMIKRGIAEVSVVQRIAQVALKRISNDSLPLWLRESIASYISGEREIVMMQVEEFRRQDWDIDPSPEAIEQDLRAAEVRADSRIAFGAAFRMLENLLEFSTLDDAVRFARLLGNGRSLDEASRDVFGIDYESLIEKVRVDKER